jgi:iron(III) transport system ATP-binding protein
MTTQTGRLELKGLVKEFGKGQEVVRAVDHLDLTIEPGEFVTFLGPSGCGKTTTLRMIAGFETPTSGNILLDGDDLSALTPDKRPMGMVFQSYALFPHMTVAENISYGLMVQKLSGEEIQKRVTDVLASMSLDNLANRAPNQLSGGQQQRVALARAMVVQPKVLLFDEPLSNLDAKLRGQMRAEIRSIQQRLGITSIFVTHDQDEAMSVSDRIVVMRNAVVQQVGTPTDIYRAPNSVFVADFIGRSNFLEVTGINSTSAGSAEVTSLGKSFTVPAHADAKAGNSLLLVRPESITVSRQPIAGKISGDGNVKTVIYYGEHVEYTLSTSNGEIVTTTSDPSPAEILAVGEKASFSFEANRAWLLPKA